MVDAVALLAVLVGFLLLCCCCVLNEMRQCRAAWAEEVELKRHKKLNGLTIRDDGKAIELIGSRPDHERPAGVDWSISMWSGKRGQYGPGDRGAP